MRGIKNKKEKIRTARGRKPSSTRWIERQLNDPFAKKAREAGYRCRAAFKILEIDEKYKIFKKGKTVIDLGAAPGGWSQVIAPKVGEGNITAIDLLEIEPIKGVNFKQGDFTDPEVLKWLEETAGKVDIVMSDMAPNTIGVAAADHLRIMALLEEVFLFATETLKPNGTMIAKVFRGGAETELLNKMKLVFKTVKHFKPDSSRQESVETFIVAQGFKG